MRSPKEFCQKYDCTIAELAGLMGVSISLAQKWSGEEYSVSTYHQNHVELLDQTFEILKAAESEAYKLRSKLCSSKLEFYENWKSKDAQ